MSNPPVQLSRNAVRGARRVAIVAIIVSLSLTAVTGIVTLLVGDFGETQSRILFTTLLLAGFSVTVLCHLAVVGRALQVVGFVGIGVSTVAAILGLVLIWGDWSAGGMLGDVSTWFVVLSVWSVSLAHANLLLLLGRRKNRVIRYGLFATVVMIGLVAVLVSLPVLTEGDIPGSGGNAYWRLLGVVAILDVLGTIVLPVASRFLHDETEPDAAAPATLRLTVPAALDARLTAEAAAAGISREDLALRLLDRGE